MFGLRDGRGGGGKWVGRYESMKFVYRKWASQLWALCSTFLFSPEEIVFWFWVGGLAWVGGSARSPPIPRPPPPVDKHIPAPNPVGGQPTPRSTRGGFLSQKVNSMYTRKHQPAQSLSVYGTTPRALPLLPPEHSPPAPLHRERHDFVLQTSETHCVSEETRSRKSDASNTRLNQ